MDDVELHVSKRLRALLPPLTDEQKKQLETNIIADGKIIDAILYWDDGTRNVIVDGMHRFEIAKKKAIAYRAEQVMIGESYEQVEAWIWDHQAGRRNLSREIIGEWYNRLKSSRGGDHTSKESKDTLLGDAAEKIAEKVGVSPSTVKRDGARVEALKRCAPAIQKGLAVGAFKVPDADLKLLATLTPEDQSAVALVLRKGQAQCVKTAMEKANVKRPAPKRKATAKPDYGKCPNCASAKWTEGEQGVVCSKCNHPHGEPAGDTDEDRLKTQRQKTVKTVEAAVRAFDDLQLMRARAEHDEAITACKRLLAIAKGWK